jgi:hypothetical protein
MSPAAVIRSAAVVASLTFAPDAWAQDSKSAPLAKQLVAALDAAKLDSIAAKDPSTADTYVAALYFAGSPLLVVSAKYTVPQLLDARLAKKEYRDAYIDLSSASVPDTKVFIQDGGADGMRAKREENQAFDSYELAGKPLMFDGDWKKQKLSEQDYMKAFSSADDRYSAILEALIAQLKKTS